MNMMMRPLLRNESWLKVLKPSGTSMENTWLVRDSDILPQVVIADGTRTGGAGVAISGESSSFPDLS
jgi:hypothetical protein